MNQEIKKNGLIMFIYTGGIGKIVNKQRIVCDRIGEPTCSIKHS